MNKDETKQIQMMPVSEFRAKGYLQEINRCFLHPLGLAISIEIGADGEERLSKIWDYRSDPEGIIFDTLSLDDRSRAKRIQQEFQVKCAFREAKLGFAIQPLPDTSEDA